MKGLSDLAYDPRYALHKVHCSLVVVTVDTIESAATNQASTLGSPGIMAYATRRWHPPDAQCGTRVSLLSSRSLDLPLCHQCAP